MQPILDNLIDSGDALLALALLKTRLAEHTIRFDLIRLSSGNALLVDALTVGARIVACRTQRSRAKGTAILPKPQPRIPSIALRHVRWRTIGDSYM